ncbi:MAG TPA: phosphodiesterase [Myxococcales bacterium]|nr:phosphodiesterase [Myxococcales bacterium]
MPRNGQSQELITPELHRWARRSIGRVQRRHQARSKANGKRAATRPLARRARRLCVVHLDGVPRQLLVEAVESGAMPFLSRLVRSGAYHLGSAFWGSPASTPAFQAGILYGIRHANLPAYQWFDRELGRKVIMNAPADAQVVDQRLAELAADGSLLEGGGTGYLALFRGGAENRTCMSALSDRRAVWRSIPEHFRGLRDAARLGAHRWAVEAARDVVDTVRDVRAWVEQVKDWRHEREYMLNRFFLVSVGWHLSRTRALIDMVRGVPAIYLVYGNYDEVAHRRGPFSAQARAELFRIDEDLEALYVMGRTVEAPYEMYLMADHGHVDSTPLEKRMGRRLERVLLEGPAQEPGESLRRGLLDGREVVPAGERGEDEPVVIEAGNFAHVYLTRGKQPLEAMDLLTRFGPVVARAARCPDIGITMLRRGDSAVAIIRGEVYSPEEIGRAPLASEFSRRAVADMLRELPHMPTAGDLVLYGESVTPTGTVGFAWEWGSHGGLTTIETDSVLLWPADGPVDLSGLSHCADLYRRLSEAYRS